MTLAQLGTALKSAISRGPGSSKVATNVALVLMVVAGIIVRIQGIGAKTDYAFDEHQYAGVAHHYLLGITDLSNCHPPLSPLLISAGMLLMGNNPVGWRFVPLVFGIQCIVLVYLIATSLFEDRRAGWLAAAFMAVDGFYITYSRASLPDIILACLVLWVILAAVTAKDWRGVLVCAVLVGAAASIKWVGLLAGLPACIALLLLRRVPWYSLGLFAIVPLVHLGVWMLGLRALGEPNGVMDVWRTIVDIRSIHLGFEHGANPLESKWYSWLALYHPIMVKISHVGDWVRISSSVGNPVLFLGANACLGALLMAGVTALANPGWRARWKKWVDPRTTKALIIVGSCWLGMMLLWMTGRIVTYYYHYLTPWAFGLILLGGVASRLDRRHPKLVQTFVVFAAAVFLLMVPIWGEIPIPEELARRLLPFDHWW